MNKHFERFLATHCAPLLYKKKAAVLFALKNIPQSCEWKLLREHGFHILRLRHRKTHQLVFIYHPLLLIEALDHPIATETLRKMGYSHEKGLNGLLAFLRKRFSESKDFPHEIGFFLGYPPEDVIGFLSCQGRCKLCGQWKVYSDVGRAVALFDEYEKCKKALLTHLKNGTSIFTALTPAYTG